MTRIIQKQTLVARLFPRLILAVLVAAVLLIPARAIHAAATPEQACQKGRYDAAAKYAACQQKAVAKLFAGGDFSKFQIATGKCQTKYTAVWPKLQAKASGSGSTCDTARFTDNGTTVTDNLSELQWEKKTDDASIHDKDNTYSWTGGVSAADGTAFTTFLPALNSGGCFAGQCDWRLPTIYELQTILLAPVPCASSPCIDPVFGPTVALSYWSATTDATLPSYAWDVDFFAGLVGYDDKSNAYYVRAVRAGL